MTSVLRIPTGQTTEQIKVISPTEAILRVRTPEVSLRGCPLAIMF